MHGVLDRRPGGAGWVSCVLLRKGSLAEVAAGVEAGVSVCVCICTCTCRAHCRVWGLGLGPANDEEGDESHDAADAAANDDDDADDGNGDGHNAVIFNTIDMVAKMMTMGGPGVAVIIFVGFLPDTLG